MPKDQWAPGTNEVEVLVPVGIIDESPIASFDKKWRAAYRTEGTNRAINATWNNLLSSIE
jgi:hypothetical protein